MTRLLDCCVFFLFGSSLLCSPSCVMSARVPRCAGDGWEAYASRCYKPFDGRETWCNSRKACQAEGADLAIFTQMSSDEVDSIITLAARNGFNQFWIRGGNQQGGEYNMEPSYDACSNERTKDGGSRQCWKMTLNQERGQGQEIIRDSQTLLLAFDKKVKDYLRQLISMSYPRSSSVEIQKTSGKDMAIVYKSSQEAQKKKTANTNCITCAKRSKEAQNPPLHLYLMQHLLVPQIQSQLYPVQHGFYEPKGADRCFYVGGKSKGNRKTFREAKEACLSLEPKLGLASITSNLDTEVLMALLGEVDTPVWIDMNGQYKGTDGERKCLSMAIRPPVTGKWRVTHCSNSNKLAYICEYAKVPLNPDGSSTITLTSDTALPSTTGRSSTTISNDTHFSTPTLNTEIDTTHGVGVTTPSTTTSIVDNGYSTKMVNPETRTIEPINAITSTSKATHHNVFTTSIIIDNTTKGATTATTRNGNILNYTNADNTTTNNNDNNNNTIINASTATTGKISYNTATSRNTMNVFNSTKAGTISTIPTATYTTNRRDTTIFIDTKAPAKITIPIPKTVKTTATTIATSATATTNITDTILINTETTTANNVTSTKNASTTTLTMSTKTALISNSPKAHPFNNTTSIPIIPSNTTTISTPKTKITAINRTFTNKTRPNSFNLTTTPKWLYESTASLPFTTSHKQNPTRTSTTTISTTNPSIHSKDTRTKTPPLISTARSTNSTIVKGTAKQEFTTIASRTTTTNISLNRTSTISQLQPKTTTEGSPSTSTPTIFHSTDNTNRPVLTTTHTTLESTNANTVSSSPVSMTTTASPSTSDSIQHDTTSPSTIHSNAYDTMAVTSHTSLNGNKTTILLPTSTPRVNSPLVKSTHKSETESTTGVGSNHRTKLSKPQPQPGLQPAAIAGVSVGVCVFFVLIIIIIAVVVVKRRKTLPNQECAETVTTTIPRRLEFNNAMYADNSSDT